MLRWVGALAAKVRCIPDAGASVDRRKRLGALQKSVLYPCGAPNAPSEPNDVPLYVALGQASSHTLHLRDIFSKTNPVAPVSLVDKFLVDNPRHNLRRKIALRLGKASSPLRF